jgi:triacylglycerol lipase
MTAMNLMDRIRALGPVLDVEAVRALYAGSAAERVPEGMRIERDVAYGADPLQRLDVYRPMRAVPGGAPVIVLVHGGGFVRGDKQERANGGIHFAKAGYLTLLPNYRLAPAAGWPAGAEDVAAVWSWARREAAARGGDPERIVLMGESAGATHVAAAALIRRHHPPGGLRPAGLVLISGPYDVALERAARRQFGIATPDTRNDAYFGNDVAHLPGRTIVDLIDAAPLPVLITFAELDLLQMQVQAGELFAHLVRQHGFAAEIAMIRDHNHVSQSFSLNTGDDALSAPVERFLRQVL